MGHAGVIGAMLAAAPSDYALLGRVLVAAIAGMVVGWERELRNHAAGLRTFSLMAVGAAVFTGAGVTTPAQSGRVIAGVATGVGFIGAGLVWRGQGRDVHGLTTAAAMWAMVAVGVIAGIGRPGFAAGIAVLVLILLELPFVPFARFIEPRRFHDRFRNDPDVRLDEPPQPDAH